MIQIVPRNPSTQELGFTKMRDDLTDLVGKMQQQQADKTFASQFTPGTTPSIQDLVKSGMPLDKAVAFSRAMQDQNMKQQETDSNTGYKNKQLDILEREQGLKEKEYQDKVSQQKILQSILGGGLGGGGSPTSDPNTGAPGASQLTGDVAPGQALQDATSQVGYSPTGQPPQALRNASLLMQQAGSGGQPMPQGDSPGQDIAQADAQQPAQRQANQQAAAQPQSQFSQLNPQQKAFLMVNQPKLYKMMMAQDAAAQKPPPQSVYDKETSKKQADEDAKYNQDLEDTYQSSLLQARALERIEQLNKSQTFFGALKQGLLPEQLKALQSATAQGIDAERVKFLDGIKRIFGSRPTNLDVQNMIKSLPSGANTQDQNDELIKSSRFSADLKRREYQVASSLRDPKTGDHPRNFQNLVNSKLSEQNEPFAKGLSVQNSQKVAKDNEALVSGSSKGIKMITPDGNEILVPENEVNDATNMGLKRK